MISYNLILLLIFVLILIFWLRKWALFFTIEKWQAYLDYVIDKAFANSYATRLVTYVANQATIDTEDQEFTTIALEFVKNVKMILGRMIIIYYVIYGKDNFREYLLFRFILRVYQDVTEASLKTLVSKVTQEQTKD